MNSISLWIQSCYELNLVMNSVLLWTQSCYEFSLVLNSQKKEFYRRIKWNARMQGSCSLLLPLFLKLILQFLHISRHTTKQETGTSRKPFYPINGPPETPIHHSYIYCWEIENGDGIGGPQIFREAPGSWKGECCRMFSLAGWLN